MSLSTHPAVDTLLKSAKHVSDTRTIDRLADVQELLKDDLAWVEAALLEASECGVLPAKNAAKHLVVLGGKRVRPTAVLLSAACVGNVPTAARELAVIVELVHTATLLHDDVIDEGMERRGARAARLAWGNAVSVLAGDTLLVHSLQRTQAVAPKLMPGLLSTLQQLVSGEIVQLRGRTLLDLSQANYDRILNEKTASLFRFATSSGAGLAGASLDAQNRLGEFGERIGIAFQLVDDVLDYESPATGKTLCADLREGKITLPLVLAAEQNSRLLAQVEQVRNGDGDSFELVRDAVLSSNACDRVRERAQRETKLALQALDGVGASPASTLLREVARQLVARSL